MLVSRKSVATGRENVMEIPATKEQLDYYFANRPIIQDYFPSLTTDQREFLISGTTPEEWADIFPEGEDYDEDQD